MPLSTFSKRRGAMFPAIGGLAITSLLLLCGAGSVPIENLLPQGPMQADLNAGGHAITNASTVSTTNLFVNGVQITNGAVGPQGPQGVPGNNGTNGATGSQGPAGANGAPGVVAATNGVSYNAGTQTVSGVNATTTNVGVVVLGNASTNAAPGSGSTNYAPASGSTNYAPAAGSTNYSNASNLTSGSVPTPQLGNAQAAISGGSGTFNLGNFTLSLNGVQIPGNLYNPTAAPSYETYSGPAYIIAGLLGDSRYNAAQGTTPQDQSLTTWGYTSRPATQLQLSGFYSNGCVSNFGVPGKGVMDMIANYAASSFTTTGNITGGTMTIPVTGSTTGLTGNFGIGGPGIGPDMYGTYSTGTITLHQANVATQIASVVGNAYEFFPQTPSASVSGATLDITTTSTGSPTYQSPHELSPAVMAVTYSGITSSTTSYTLTGFSSMQAVMVGAKVTGSNIAANTTVVSWNATSITLNKYPSASGSTSVTVTPIGHLHIAIGTNDAGGSSGISATATSGSAVLSGTFPITNFVPGYQVSGTYIQSGTTIVSATATSVTLSKTATGSGTTSLTLTVVDSAWEAQYSILVNMALADGWVVFPNTIFPGPGYSTAVATHINTWNAWILATYGTTSLGNYAYSGTTANVYPIDVASLPFWSASNFSANNLQVYAADGIHENWLGSALMSDAINGAVCTIFPNMVNLSPSGPWNRAYGIPASCVQPSNFLTVDPTGAGGSLRIGTSSANLVDNLYVDGADLKGASGGYLRLDTGSYDTYAGNFAINTYNAGLVYGTPGSGVAGTFAAGVLLTSAANAETDDGTAGQLGTHAAARFTATPLATPPAPTITVSGTAGSTTWGYVLVAINQDGTASAASPIGVTATGPSTETGSNYCNISAPSSAPTVYKFKVYRVTVGTSPTTSGYIGTIGAGQYLADPALAGDGTTPPIAPTSGVVSADHVALAQSQYSVAGSISGTNTFSMPFQGSGYKKIVFFDNGLAGSATYPYPSACTNAPVLTNFPACITNSVITTTNMTLYGNGGSGMGSAETPY